MKSLIKYSLHDYIRSHKYFPPLSTFVILIFIFYTYKPNPIIDSYAVTAIIVYIISAWLSLSILSIESPVHRGVLSLHTGGWNRYYISKIISVVIIAVFLSFYAILYPIMFSMFNDPLTITMVTISFVNHMILAILGVSIASFFSRAIMTSSINSFGGLSLVIVLSIAALGIAQILPLPLKFLTWIIPPATATQTALYHWNGDSVSGLSVFPFIWIVLYSFLLLYLFLTLAKRMR